MKERIGEDVSGGQMMDIMLGLREAGINQVPGAVCVAVTEEGVLVEKGGVQELVPGQHVVVAVGSQSCRPCMDPGVL